MTEITEDQDDRAELLERIMDKELPRYAGALKRLGEWRETETVLTDTEIAFLRERLDEDEAAAKAATPGPWYAFNSGHGDEWYVSSRSYGQVSTGLHSDPDGDEILMIERDHRDAAHIARHDPARALRDVAVWRKLLLEYHSAPLDAVYGDTERETGFRLALSAALKAKIATYDGNPVTGEPFPSRAS